MVALALPTYTYFETNCKNILKIHEHITGVSVAPSRGAIIVTILVSSPHIDEIRLKVRDYVPKTFNVEFLLDGYIHGIKLR